MKCVCSSACEYVKNRVDKVVGQRGYDSGKNTSDNDADCHVHDIAAQGKCFEFFHEFFYWNFRLKKCDTIMIT